MIDSTSLAQETFLPVPDRAPVSVPEWTVIQAAIRKSQAWDALLWTALARCPVVTLYCDGGTLVRNPGGPAGIAVVGIGKDPLADVARAPGGRERARLELGVHVPARLAPPTSRDRAELAGVLGALAVLQHLGARGWHAASATIWSDSRYVVECANRRWQRRRHPDLWQLYAAVETALRRVVPHGITVAWVQGHAGYGYNAVADDLATRAALEFDAGRYARYRAAQAATGAELPAVEALAQVGLTAAGAPPPDPAEAAASPVLLGTDPTPPAPPAHPGAWIRDAHYTLVVYAAEPAGEGWYQLWTKDGRSLRERVPRTRQAGSADARALEIALTGLLWRIRAAGRHPQDYTLDVVRAAGASGGPGPAADPLLRQFKTVGHREAPRPAIAGLFRATPE